MIIKKTISHKFAIEIDGYFCGHCPHIGYRCGIFVDDLEVNKVRGPDAAKIFRCQECIDRFGMEGK